MPQDSSARSTPTLDVGCHRGTKGTTSSMVLPRNSGSAGPSAGGPIPADAVMAQRNFELNNDMITLDASDSIFHYDSAEQRRIGDLKPWKKE